MYRKAIILDFDDTIAASYQVRSDSLRKALSSYLGRQVTLEQVRSHWGLPFEKLIFQIDGSVEIEEFVAVYQNYMTSARPVALPGVPAALERWADLGILVVVFSASLTDLIRVDLDFLGISELIAEVFGSDRTRLPKPELSSIVDVLDWLVDQGVGRDEALYIGDSIADYEIAHKAGVDFIPVITGRHTESDFRNIGYRGITVKSLVDVDPFQER